MEGHLGRKNLSSQRKEEILNAFELSIAKYGFANSSTHRISEVAKVKQPIIAHYFGNKEAMVEALVDRIMNDYVSRMQEALGDSSGNTRIQNLLDFLFGPGLLGNITKRNLIGQLLAASLHDEKLRDRMKGMYTSFLAMGVKELQVIYPEVSSVILERVVYGVLCLAVGNDALLSVSIPYSNRLLARQCADALISQLTMQRNCKE